MKPYMSAKEKAIVDSVTPADAAKLGS